jgi:hypothetical protein
VILRKRRARPEVLCDFRQNDPCEMTFFEPKDPAPNPEEAYGLHERQILVLRAIRRLDPKTASANSHADEARMVGQRDQPSDEYP